MNDDETTSTEDDIPPITTLHIDVTDKRGIRYEGTFVYKVPNMREDIEIGRRRSVLLPVAVINDANALVMAEMIAYLDVTIQKGEKNSQLPKWWKPLEFYDSTPIVALYAEATAYGRRFLGELPDVRGDKEEAAEEHSDDDRGAVDGPVSPPVERRSLHRSDSAGSASTGASRRSSSGGTG